MSIITRNFLNAVAVPPPEKIADAAKISLSPIPKPYIKIHCKAAVTFLSSSQKALPPWSDTHMTHAIGM